MSAPEKTRPTRRLVNAQVGDHRFKLSPEKADAVIRLLEDYEESVPASEVFPDLLNEKKRSGIVLRGLRERDNLTQEDVAKKIDRPQSWISAMETGARPIGPKMAALLAKVFKIDANVFESQDASDEDAP